MRPGGKVTVIFPPVNAHFLGLVNRGDQQADFDGQQVNIGDLNADIAGNHNALVEHPLQDIGQISGIDGCKSNLLVGSQAAHCQDLQ